MALKKRRYLDRLIADLQQNGTDINEPSLQKRRRTIAVPLYFSLHPMYEFFLIGEINLELQLGVSHDQEEYFPIGVKQSPLNKWRPFVKAESFKNRVEMTIDAYYQGLSEFEFIVQRLQGCSNEIYKQLAVYLNGYQHFVRKVRDKMLQNPVPQRLYEFKQQNFLKCFNELVNKLPSGGLYAVSLFYLDYQIFNTKRVKFIVSKALVELISGVDQLEGAQLLLRKGWLEIFGGPQRIMKNIMLLNRLMKEGRQLLEFKIHTVDRIPLSVQAEIEIVESLHSFVDIGFAEIIQFFITPQQIEYLKNVRNGSIPNLPVENEVSEQFNNLKSQQYSQQETNSKIRENKEQEERKVNSLKQSNYKHPNLFKHERDIQYKDKSFSLLQKFYTHQEIKKFGSQNVMYTLQQTKLLQDSLLQKQNLTSMQQKQASQETLSQNSYPLGAKCINQSTNFNQSLENVAENGYGMNVENEENGEINGCYNMFEDESLHLNAQNLEIEQNLLEQLISQQYSKS